MRRLAFAIISALILLSSCTGLSEFVSGDAVSESISLDEKLTLFADATLEVPMPEVFFEGSVWLERFIELVENAEDYIFISTFLGSNAPAIEPLFDALMDAAGRGVRVYFVIDGISSYDMTASNKVMTPLYFLREGGVHIEEYNPLTTMHLFAPHTIIIRDHRKLLVVDGKIAAIGGMNINYISVGAGEGSQRDSMYLFHSPDLASALSDIFLSIWNSISVEEIKAEDFQRYEDESGTNKAYLFNTGKIAAMYSSLISSAEDEIILLPYLPALNDSMKSALASASAKGVDVEMLIPIDLRGYAASGIYQALPDLISSTGVKLHASSLDEEGNILPLLHEKLMIVDSRYVVIGSANFNYRSMTLSEELCLVIESEELALRLKEHVASIEALSEEITLSDAERLKKDEGSGLAYLFMYFGG